MARRWNDPAYKAKVGANISQALVDRLATDPAYAARVTATASANMTARHQDPVFQVARGKRSSEVMRRNWEDPTIRATLQQAAVDRYSSGVALNSPEGIANKKIANKWIMRQCQKELIANTEYANLYKETQARIRLERPYDGPKEHADYQEYLSNLGKAVVSDPDLRALHSAFMAEAIPRWAAAWKELRAANQTDGAQEQRP